MLPYLGQIMTATHWAYEWEMLQWIMLQDSNLNGDCFSIVKKKKKTLQKVHINGNEFKPSAAAGSYSRKKTLYRHLHVYRGYVFERVWVEYFEFNCLLKQQSLNCVVEQFAVLSLTSVATECYCMPFLS